MTRLEALAAAYPLHVQRIAELTVHKDRMSERSQGARGDLLGAFEFLTTTEGHDYWWALFTGAGLQ